MKLFFTVLFILSNQFIYAQNGSWDVDSLHQNEEMTDSLKNQMKIDKLVQEGDDLSQPRQVDHWIYFKTAKDRDEFISSIKNDNFHIENSDLISANDLPFQLHLSREDHVDLVSINKVTLQLRNDAKIFGGEYDGWETLVIKKD